MKRLLFAMAAVAGPAVLTSCLPKIEVVGFDQGEMPMDWAPSVAYYGEAKSWPSFVPHLRCALDRVDDEQFAAGLVVRFEKGSSCSYDHVAETVRAPDFRCAIRQLEARAYRFGWRGDLERCNPI